VSGRDSVIRLIPCDVSKPPPSFLGSLRPDGVSLWTTNAHRTMPCPCPNTRQTGRQGFAGLIPSTSYPREHELVYPARCSFALLVTLHRRDSICTLVQLLKWLAACSHLFIKRELCSTDTAVGSDFSESIFYRSE